MGKQHGFLNRGSPKGESVRPDEDFQSTPSPEHTAGSNEHIRNDEAKAEDKAPTKRDDNDEPYDGKHKASSDKLA